METKTLTKEQIELLNKPLPEEAIKKHPTKSYLSTINAIYVTERFNEVFGVGKWSIKLEHIDSAQVKSSTMVVTKTTFEVPEYGIYYECFGGNDNADLGDAYKGSTTDALTKIGSYLGVGAHVWKNDPHPRQNKPVMEQSERPTQAELKTFIDNCNTVEDFGMLQENWGTLISADVMLKGYANERYKKLVGGNKK